MQCTVHLYLENTIDFKIGTVYGYTFEKINILLQEITSRVYLFGWRAERVNLIYSFAVWRSLVDLYCLLSKSLVEDGDILDQFWR